MLGGIYSDEKCPVCGGGLRDNGRNAVCCPKHPKHRASRFIVRFGRSIKKRFSDYAEASRFLNGLRFKTDEGSFDSREYQSGDPLGFSTLASQYIALREREHQRGLLAKGTMNAIRNELGKAMAHFGVMSVKHVRMPALQEFLFSFEGLSSKSLHNMRTNLHAFWQWMVDSDIIASADMPKFPVVEFELGWRKTVSKSIQDSILDEVYNLTMPLAPRVYLAIRWLSIYVSIRPSELLKLTESSVDYDGGRLIVSQHKTAKKIKAPKVVPLLNYDLEFLRSLPRSLDRSAPLFRHDYAYNSNLKPNTPFGAKILYRYWKRACENLGIEGVDLYGGTRHSTMQFYREHMSTEDVLRLSAHTTSKAGLRYLKIQEDELRRGFELAGGTPNTDGTPMVHRKKATKVAKFPKPQ